MVSLSVCAQLRLLLVLPGVKQRPCRSSSKPTSNPQRRFVGGSPRDFDPGTGS